MFGCSHRTVKRYVDAGRFVVYKQPERPRKLRALTIGCASGLGGNADMVRQELIAEKGTTELPADPL